MVNFSFDDDAPISGGQTAARRRSPPLRVSRNDLRTTTKSRKLNEGKVRKVINGEVVYVRIRRVVRN
tara:strand:- start:142 stop:342 length:201 start_codon:yes stop_codon:yes gene_type:complete